MGCVEAMQLKRPLERSDWPFLGSPTPLLLMWWYGVTTLFSLITYIAWARDASGLSDGVTNAFAGFAVISVVVYILLSASSFYWAWQTVGEAKGQRIRLGILCFFVAADSPILATHMLVLYRIGARDSYLQTIDMGLRFVSWICGFFFLWVSYLIAASKYFHETKGYNRPPLEQVWKRKFGSRGTFSPYQNRETRGTFSPYQNRENRDSTADDRVYRNLNLVVTPYGDPA